MRMTKPNAINCLLLLPSTANKKGFPLFFFPMRKTRFFSPIPPNPQHKPF